MEKRLGVGFSTRGGVLIHLLLENSKCSGTVKTIYKEHNRWWQCNASVWHCAATSKKSKRVDQHAFSDATAAARTRIAPLVLSC
mmetsp:Transcript_8206/g.20184  ORF Transcript_8206/g.20184 Transcript_8206/m.20184 type:complete len:84 (-) Transcript_8206:59-310(-)